MSWILTAATAKAPRNRSLLRWAGGGWAFFIAENALLSENRTALIDQLGDERYHLVYGTLSTIATASIGYAYFKLNNTKSNMPSNLVLWRHKPTLAAGFASWAVLSVGLVMASQAAPKMQIPVTLASSSSTSSSTLSSLSVRCPFDFSDKNHNDFVGGSVHGLDRISRHPGLWSFGLMGMGQAFLAPNIPRRIWWLGPAAVALLGGAHQDSRFRRGLGGTLSPHYESLTSNVPFVAMLTGKQGSQSWEGLWKETKPLNAMAAVAVSSLWVLRRMR